MTRTKKIGDAILELDIDKTGKQGMVSCESGWCSGVMEKDDAISLFDSINTIAHLNEIVSDAYDRASGREC